MREGEFIHNMTLRSEKKLVAMDIAPTELRRARVAGLRGVEESDRTKVAGVEQVHGGSACEETKSLGIPLAEK